MIFHIAHIYIVVIHTFRFCVQTCFFVKRCFVQNDTVYLSFSWYRCVISFRIHDSKVLGAKERKEALLCFCVLHMVLSLLCNNMMPS